MRVGVLALQGAFREHIYALEALGVAAEAVRLPSQMDDLSGLIIPGGESTAISKLMDAYGFYDALPERVADGMGVWGTCAGAILAARSVADALPGQRSLDLIDISVRRNAYGRQVDSFEVNLHVKGLDDPYRGVFIRAPRIEMVGEGVEVIAEHDGFAVAAAAGRVMVTTFHPELTGDPRMHLLFVKSVIGS